MEIKIEKLHKQAVDTALSKDWDTAIQLHNMILEMDPSYLDAYLGLGFAYFQKGDLKKAKSHYRKALDFDPVNVIARNNIDKLNILLKKGNSLDQEDTDVSISPDTFMHIEGKTRVITLSNIGQADVIARLKVGEHVYLKVKKRRVEIRNKKGEYVGCLPDDMSKRLSFFLEGKSEYDVIIKAATKNSVDVFIKEKKKGAKVKNFVSFPENIQDDLKKILNRSAANLDDDDADESESDEDDDDSDEDDDEYEDLEELAKKAEEGHEDDDIMSEIDEDTLEDED